jgi:hypothetical protein
LRGFAIRRRWVWSFGTLGVLALLVYGGGRWLDEPVRRYMETQANQRLTGYTVQVPKVRVHLWKAAVDVYDVTLLQEANPDPPVLQMKRFVTRVDWRALLHRRVVADLTFDRPTVFINLRQVRTEVASDVPLKERGWQAALEALTLDLKINQLRILDGTVTYVDAGPYRPLHLSRLNVTAENIRNIRSNERVYPSDLHVEAVAFDAGQVWLDGRADFLAEPHPGIDVAVRVNDLQLDYFKPITNRYNLSVRNGHLSLSGSVEYAPRVARLMLAHVLIQGVALDYTHTPHTAKAEHARVEQTARAAQQVANAPAVQLRIDRLDVANSTFAFVNRAASPSYRVLLTEADLRLENLSNHTRDGRASVSLTGQLMGSGPTRLTAAVQPQTGGADLDLTTQIDRADLGRLSELVRAYAGIDVHAGELSVYSELTMRGRGIDGYVKPLLRDVRVGSPDGSQRDTPLKRRLYEGLLEIAATVLKNRSRGEIATVVQLTGPVDRPHFSRWETIGQLLQNAFLQPIRPGFERTRSPIAGPSSTPDRGVPGSEPPWASPGAVRPTGEAP